MKVTKPFRPLVLILIGALLGLTTGTVILASRQGPAPTVPLTQSSVSPTRGQAQVEPGAIVPTPTRVTIATPEPAVAVKPSGAPASPTPTTARIVPTPVPPRPVVVENWERAQIDSAGIGLQVPGNWAQVPDAWAWSPDGSDDLQIGLTWIQPEDGWTPRAMLPRSADTYETKEVNLGWSIGTSYLVEVSGEMNTVERHVVVRVDDELAVDFYARAATTAELMALEPILEHVLQSIIVNAYAGDPVDVSVQFLAALMSNTESSSYLSDQLREAVQNGRSILSLLGVENLYSSFSVSLISAADGRMTVQADLDYGAGRVEERLLTLVQQDGTWRIDDISSPG
jgi:hypothetical protein